MNPFGDLWSQGVADNSVNQFHHIAAQFEADVMSVSGAGSVPDAIASLAQPEIEKFSYAVDPRFDGGESEPQNMIPTNGIDDYLSEFNLSGAPGGFHDAFAATVPAPLTADQIIHRALAQSCAGCHQPTLLGLTQPNSIGSAVRFDGTAINSWPTSLGFVHVNDVVAGGAFAISPALSDVFLPFRKHNLETELARNTCLCKHEFQPFPNRQRLFDVQKGILDRLRPKLIATKPAPAPGQSPVAKPSDVTRLRDVEEAFDKQLGEALKAEGVKLEPLALDRKPQPQRVAMPAGADTDEKKAAVRRAAVIEQLRSEPPRRTVTGHFRVH